MGFQQSCDYSFYLYWSKKKICILFFKILKSTFLFCFQLDVLHRVLYMSLCCLPKSNSKRYCLYLGMFLYMQCAKLPVDRVYVNSHQSIQKPIDKDRLSMKFFFLWMFLLSVYASLGRSMLFNFVIDLMSIRLQILVFHTVHV